MPGPCRCRSWRPPASRKRVAQGGEHSHAAVGAGAAAQGQHDPGRVQAEGEQDGFAEAAAGGGQRVQLFRRAGVPRPQVLATSTTAVTPSKAMLAWTGWPVGPATV